ncbi:MAG: TIGR00180 family glycosyltransferase [Bacillota bacterium]|nr:TIGR00180 family glycosyltransferase [Bacillota bacterium]MDW7684819.1 TIGR00180 family glycosyltransferase [Bacillota bacterium]
MRKRLSKEKADTMCEIIIPTYNRHCYFDRIISHYRHFRYPVTIIDASSNKYSFAELPSNISYSHMPMFSIYKRLKTILKQSKAKYVMLIADDDFVFESSLKKGIHFLKKNSDFSLVQGRWLGFNKDNVNHKFAIYTNRQFRDCREVNAKIRCRNYLNNYFMTFWALYRKETLTAVCRILDKLNVYNFRMSEIIQAAMTCYYGKIKFINCVLGAREVNQLKVPDDKTSVIVTSAKSYKVYH